MNKAIVVMMAIAATSLCNGQDTSCGNIWQKAQRLSDESFDAYTPQIVTQGDTVHVFYESNSNRGRIPYARSTDGGVTFEPLRDLIPDSVTFHYANVENLLPVADSRRLSLFFIGGTEGGDFTPIYMITSTDRGESWSPVKAITVETGFPRCATMVGDTIAIVALFRSLHWDRSVCTTDGGEHWSIGTDSLIAGESRSAISRRWLHAVYYRYLEGYSFEIVYKRSSDFGMTWRDSAIISTPDDYGGVEPVIISDGENSVWIAWKEAKYGCYTPFSCGVALRQSTDGGSTWLAEQVLTDIPNGFQIRLFSHGTDLVANWTAEVIDNTEYDPVLRFSQNGGTTWCPIFDLANDTLGRGPLSVAIGTSALQAAWEAYVDRKYVIMYRRGAFSPSAVDEDATDVPHTVTLQQNYPNPFNNRTIITYALREAGDVRLVIYNLLGIEVHSVFRKAQAQGRYAYTWEAADQPSGLYFYRLSTKASTLTGKALLIK